MATAGTVTVDNNVGAVRAAGMQFASDGYVITGDAITLVGAPSSIIRVGDGTAAGAGYTATINSVLTGNTQLIKTDLGTLVLQGTIAIQAARRSMAACFRSQAMRTSVMQRAACLLMVAR